MEGISWQERGEKDVPSEQNIFPKQNEHLIFPAAGKKADTEICSWEVGGCRGNSSWLCGPGWGQQPAVSVILPGRWSSSQPSSGAPAPEHSKAMPARTGSVSMALTTPGSAPGAATSRAPSAPSAETTLALLDTHPLHPQRQGNQNKTVPARNTAPDI